MIKKKIKINNKKINEKKYNNLLNIILKMIKKKKNIFKY